MNPPFRQGCRIARMLVLALGPAAMPFGLHSQPTRTARVSGRVTDRSTGGPIALAELLVIHEGRLFTTGSAGPDALSGLAPRDGPLPVHAPRFPEDVVVDAGRPAHRYH